MNIAQIEDNIKQITSDKKRLEYLFNLYQKMVKNNEK
ncbi:hypothetical protein SAMN05216234_15613 [Hydrogenimonas thermophila]|uniref:Uncharacterized protein n=1 Tax=Hydrogenimonas thermophila TaxID=223786 RepID=A0A1I5U895_9BACT|nr:hypothetical protein SAMN05216234_15613 [Hydrogenimonas thermophila]